MNLALVTSYIIAAMLMLSIIMMNLRMSSSSAELVLTQITRQHASTVADLLNDDIPNMGYNVNDVSDQILTIADSRKIQFYRNVYNDPNSDPELITWELTDEEVTNTKNPDHRTLVRTELDEATGEEQVTEIRIGVTKFQLYYFSEHGVDKDDPNEIMMTPVPASDLSSIKQIYLEFEMQSAEPVYSRANADGRYIRSVYEKRFSPRNLDLN